MRNMVNTYIDRFRHQRRIRRRAAALMLALAVVVAGGVFWQLRYTGVAMANETTCGCEEHTHDESCYETVLICGIEEGEATEGHAHDASCYETVQILTCEQEESEGHAHDEACFDEEGSLICGFEESEGHAHDESCCEEEPVLVCDQDEEESVEGHIHGESCCEEVLICEIPEHTHTVECMIDVKADVETAKDWEATLPELTGVRADDVVAIAQSQIGYAESTKNFRLAEDGETRQGYTRYGAWYGNEYGDWEAMFASFCLYYAGIPESEFPEASGVYAWMTDLKKLERYADAADYTPVPGDILFFDNDGDREADHVGIVEEVSSGGDRIRTIEGNSSNQVKENSYAAGDKAILGYGILPEPFESEEVSDPEVPYETPNLKEQTVEAQIFSEKSGESSMKAMSVSDSGRVILSGLLPENAAVKAVPVDVQIGDMTILAAYDITIWDENGYEFEPEDGQIHVTICSSAIRRAMDQGAEPVVCHISDETSALENVDVTAADDGAVEFDAESFSIYIVGENDEYINTETGEHVTVYTVEFYQYEFDATDNTAKGPTKTSTQYVTETDTLNEPAVPEYEHHVFDGWFTEMQEAADNEPGNKFNFSATLGENLTAWGADYELHDHHTIELYTDYDPVYYVYFMTEEDPTFGKTEDYVSYVFHTNTYHEKDSILDTADVGILYWQQYLQLEGESIEQATTFAVVDWYYYDEDDEDADEYGKVLISGKADVNGDYHVKDDITLYPVVEGAVWMYFDMCITDPSEVYIEPSPAYVLSGTTVGSSLPGAERPGYTFDGWFTEEAGGTEITSAATFSQLLVYAKSGEVTLYAHWTPTTVGYTVNIWRQKAVDGQAGLDQKTVQNGEEYEDYIRYYDYAESITIDAKDERALTTGSADLTYQDFGSYTSGTGSNRQTRYYWNDWTGCGWTGSSDGTGEYVGFEYNQARTENDLATITVKPDGSTIINIFYDRVTITYNFGTSNNSTSYGTLIGLYDTNVKVEEDNKAGSLNSWPDPPTGTGQNANQAWQFASSSSGYGNNVNYSYTHMTFLAKFTLETNALHDSNVVDFTADSVSGTAYLYYYLEVTDPDRQITSGSQTITITRHDGQAVSEQITYVLDQRVSIASSTRSGNTTNAMSFNFSDKYIGYTYTGYNTDGGTNINTQATSVELSNNGNYYLFNDAITYTFELYSNHNGEQRVWSDIFKYGEPLSSVELPTELDAAEYGPAYYYQFTGTWWEDPTFTAEFFKPYTMPANNLAAYADWELKDITVTFVSSVESDLYDRLFDVYGVYDEDINPTGVADNGDGSYSITIKASESVSDTLAALTAEDENRYTFVSWMNGSSIFNITGHLYDDTTLRASWNDSLKETHTLTYDLNLDPDAEGDDRVTYSDKQGHSTAEDSGEWLLEVEDAFPNYEFDEGQADKFICWNTEKDGSGTDYYPDELYNFTKDHEDVTLYAKWATELESTLHIHYNYPEGYYDSSVDTEYPDVDITVENLGTVDLGQSEEGDNNGYYVALQEGDEITIAGVTYRFVGWSTDPEATSAEIDPGATVAVDGTDTDENRINDLYAVWLAELQFSIEKTDTADTRLDGAEFTLSCTRTIEVEGKEGEEPTTATETRYYGYDESVGTYRWVEAEDPEKIPTITLGSIEFTDHNGDLDGSEIFTLTEITAPDGYQRLANAVVFMLNPTDSSVQITSNVASSNYPGRDLASAEYTALTVRNEGNTYPADIFKYTGDLEDEFTALPDAEFVLSQTVTETDEDTGEETEVTYFGVFEKTEIKSEQFGGTLCYFTFSHWTEDLSEATTLISGADGFVHMDNLEIGHYCLTETKAPDGYMLLDDAIQFVIFAGGYVTEETVINAGIYKDRDIITLYIGNDPGVELPMTGGPGTWIYILSGLVMMSGAGILFYWKKRSEVRA